MALGAVDAALLAVLALDGPQTRQSMAALLWPDGGAAKPAANLRQRIFKLKRLFGSDVVMGDRTISLACTVSHDLQDLEARTSADPESGRGALLGTLTLKDNERFADWLASRREWAVQTRVRVLDDRARQLADDGDTDAALRFARARVQTRPLDEVGHRALIGLLYRRHDRAAAMAAYRDCERLLNQELGIEPSMETQELLRQLNTAHPGDRPSRSAPLSLAFPPALVGRDDAWQAIEQAHLGGVTPLLVAGPGGGKSRLLTDFAARNAGWTVVRCLPGDEHVPLSLLQRLLASCATKWGQPDPACGIDALWKRQATDVVQISHTGMRSVSALLAQWHRAGLTGVAVDDCHHADATSWALLMPSLACGAGPRWLLASRPEERWTPASDLAVRIALKPLTWPQVETLVDSLNLPGLPGNRIARSLHRRVGGRPRALLSTLSAAFLAGRTGADDVARWLLPPQLRSDLSALISGLSPTARELTHLAALAGTAFHAEVARSALRLPLDTLSAAWQELQARLEMNDDGTLPEAVSEVAVEGLATPARLALHLALAQALEAHGADAAVLAHHWEHAARWSKAAGCHEHVAQESHARSDRPAQRHHWHEAARCWSLAGRQRDAFSAAASEAECALTAGDPGECARICEALQPQARSPAEWARVLRLHAWALGYQRDWQAALDVVERALPAARLVGNSIWLSEALGLQVFALALLGRGVEAQARLPELLALDVSGADWELQLNHRTRIADAYTYLNRLPEALSTMESCVALAERPEAQTQRLSLLSNTVMLLFKAGRPMQGILHARQAVSQAEQVDQLHGQVGGQALIHLGLMAAAQGLYAEAIERAEQGVAVLRRLGAPQPLAIANNHIAWVWCCLGQGARAQLALSEVGDDAELYLRLRRWTIQAHLERLCGLPPPKTPPADWALCSDVNVVAQAEMVMASALAPHEGMARLADIQARCVANGHPAHALHASLLRVQALRSVDAEVAAAAASTAALQLEETTPLSAYRPEMHLILHLAMKAGGDVGAAEAQLKLAWTWVERAAKDHVPSVFRDAFLVRNQVNLAIHRAMTARA